MAQVGRWIAGHSLFIVGQPSAFSPILARHFFIVESLMLPGNAALCCSHYVSSLAGNTERTAMLQQQLAELGHRTEALTFWSKHSTRTPEEPSNVAMRISAVTIQAMLAPMWMLVAAWSPASVHQALGSATDILQKKYVATTTGAPHHFYTPHIDRMTVAKNAHVQNGNTLNPNYAAAIFITLFVLVHFR